MVEPAEREGVPLIIVSTTEPINAPDGTVWILPLTDEAESFE